MIRHILLAAVLVIGAAPPPGRCLMAFAQAKNESAAQETKARSANAIAGRVLNESGQPMPNGTVYVTGTGKQPTRRATSVDEDGRFRVDGLPRGVYYVSTQVRGYVLASEPGEPASYRPGDTVNLVVRKGGVITGTVTGSSGEPVVAVRMSAIPLRDLEGHPRQRSGGEFPRYTDDRGVYRLFGLSPGFYLVVAGSKLPGPPMQTPFDQDVLLTIRPQRETPRRKLWFGAATKSAASTSGIAAGAAMPSAAGSPAALRLDRGYKE